MQPTDRDPPFTTEQFESLHLLVLTGANVVAARRYNLDPQKLIEAERQFAMQIEASKRILVRGE